ncbi:MAG: hypothetical protein JWQ04_693 [Pedosphaera sp.]|nr:hypothetical protein [Pedosphaera sp.]
MARAEVVRCDICGQPLQLTFYTVEDRVEHKNKKLCQDCEKIEARCFICNLPVREGFKRLPDGRYICARELNSVIESESDAKEICKGVRNDLDRLLSRFLTFPDDNVQLSIVDQFHLSSLFKAPGDENSSVEVYGATSTHTLPGHKFVHSVDLLSHLQKPRLMAVCAHEYTHTWMNENLTRERHVSIEKNTMEGFCELVAYKYMESLNEQGEMEHLKQNNYTVGQILVLIEADNKYGFNAVMEWIKNGEDTTLSLANLDRVRALRDGVVTHAAPAAAPGLVYGTAAVPTPVPDTLVLKGISGSGTHRFALINNTTFEAMEKAKVRVGQTTRTVNCLQIGKDSVTIQVDGSAEKQQLFLR